MSKEKRLLVELVLVFACLIEFTLSGCRPTEKDLRPIVSVTVEPQAFLVDRIGGERVRTIVLVPVGREPENYQATPEKIATICKAGAWFQTGMPFETPLGDKLKSLAPSMKFVDLRQGIPFRKLELHAHEAHADHHHADHANCAGENGSDPHIWTGPTVLKTQAATILKTLQEIDPANGEEYSRNYDLLIADIEKTRQAISERLEPYQGETIFVFHPGYGYFCDEFGLRQQAIEFEGKSPTAKELAALVALAKKEKKPPTIIVQPEFNRAPADAIAESIGGSVVVHSPLDRDLLDNLIRLAELVAK